MLSIYSSPGEHAKNEQHPAQTRTFAITRLPRRRSVQDDGDRATQLRLWLLPLRRGRRRTTMLTNILEAEKKMNKEASHMKDWAQLAHIILSSNYRWDRFN